MTTVGVGGSGPTTVGVGGQSMVTSSVTTTAGVGGGMGTTSAGVGGFGPATSVGVGGSGQGGFSPFDCLSCVGQNCPQALQCLTDPTCAQGVFCTVQTCLSGGIPDFICALNCFNGDVSAATLALQSVGCIFTQCGSECASILGP